MEVIILDRQSDPNKVIDNINRNVIFLLDDDMPLYEYIDNLRLSGAYQIKLRICKELHGLDAFLLKDGPTVPINTLSELLENINAGDKATVVVRGDMDADKEKQNQVRIKLGNIVQQLVYLNIPLSDIQVMTEKEACDIDKIRHFDENIDNHEQAICESIEALEKAENNTAGYREAMLESVNNIRKYLELAKNNELKIAAAASKKSGKSVVVNSIIEKELAPTSLEIATPNNCIYKPSGTDKYTLEYNNESHTYSDPIALRDYIGEQFKKASEDYENGKGIPDMNIGYVSNRKGFSQYTIYDTPGPDRAGADAHKDAANRAIRNADVIIFSIDYSKHLTDFEVNYLQEIKEIFNENQKNYSLIININKLDLRYTSSGDKNIVRIMDFIRQELIKIAPEFAGAVVIGTSALTYFNCIAAPELKGCEILLESECICDNIKKCKALYACTDEMSIISQINTMITNAEDFHAINIENLEQLKQFSGMPNLLSYVDYIATTKARNEKVNNLIYKIETEYQKIMNHFRFADLEKALLENQDKLDEAKRILQTFHDEIENIFDDEYKDIYNQIKADKDLPINERRYKSNFINDIGQKMPIDLNDISVQFSSAVKEDIDINKMAENISEKQIPHTLSIKIDKIFNDETKVKKRKNDCTGQTEMATAIQDIQAIYKYVLKDRFLNELIHRYLESRCAKLNNGFSEEYKNISIDLACMLNSRNDKLRESVEKCKSALREECEIPFELETTDFTFEFESVENIVSDKNFSFGIHIDKTMEKLNEYSIGAKHSTIGYEYKIEKLIQSLKDFFMGNNDLISKENAKAIYKDKKLNAEVLGNLQTSDELKSVFADISGKLISQTQNFVNKIIDEINAVCSNAKEMAQKTNTLLDHTGEYEVYIKQLNDERNALYELEKCISTFTASWKGE